MECDTREIKQNHIARDQTGPRTAFQVTADKFTTISFQVVDGKELILTAVSFNSILSPFQVDFATTAKQNKNWKQGALHKESPRCA